MISTYYPEMNHPKPVSKIEGRFSYDQKHVIVKTPLTLKGKGVKHLGVLTAGRLTPQSQHKVGWNEYQMTIAAAKAMADVVAVELFL